LTLIRAGLLAGASRGSLAVVSSNFLEWERIVRYPLYWATNVDPCGSSEQLQADDQTVQTRNAFILAWKKLCLVMGKSEEGITTAEAITQLSAWDQSKPIAGELTTSAHQDLVNEFKLHRPAKSSPRDWTFLGYCLRRHKGTPTIHGRLKDVEIDSHAKINAWRVI
jgi:hypothetical protein